MFVNKGESNKNQLEIVYDVQWKTPGNDDDKAKIIGIVDTPDTYLDWNTFKSYLIQNSGMRFTTDDIRISYLDSDDDLIPVDSESEFRECLKFSRTRAKRGRKIVMKISMISNGGAKPKHIGKHPFDNIPKNPTLFCLKKRDIIQKKPNVSFETSKKSPENTETVPEWFETYMTKFKAELIEDVTSAVVNNLRPVLTSMTNQSNTGPQTHSRVRNGSELPPQSGVQAAKTNHYVIEKRCKKKKKMPEEDSSDCTDGLQLQWEERLELLRHMQKINKREKKFEKKLDAKLEKLECKTKKIMEKKNSFFSRKITSIPAPPPGGSQNQFVNSCAEPTAPLSTDLANNQCMDATPVDECNNYTPHVYRGDVVYQIWKVMNNGQKAWTDETELRFAWGSKSLVPLTTVVKCPPLQPGEIGKVQVTLQAPLFPGSFESYWHFHHQGRRFGHWLGCAVIVDADQRPISPRLSVPCEITSNVYPNDQGPLPVDLTMKCQQQQQQQQSYSDDMKIYNNIETNKSDQTTQDADSSASKPDVIKSPIKTPLLKDMETAAYRLECFLSNEMTTPGDKPEQRQSPVKCVTETELEEFPRLESYTSLTSSLSKPELLSYINETYPDLMSKPDLKTWPNYDEQPELKKDNIIDTDDKKDSLEQNLDKTETEEKYEKVLNGVENMCIKDEEQKQNNDDKTKERDVGEYISGSDSDNISIISGTVSVDSDDSEPSDEFVVVPMPTCLNCELDQTTIPATQPISVEIPKSSSDSDISAHAVQASDSNNNMEDLQPFPEMPQVYMPVLITGDFNNSGVSEPCNHHESLVTHAGDQELVKDEKESTPDNEESSDDMNTVYVRDETGKSVPVAKVISSKKKESSKSKSASSSPTPTNISPNVGVTPAGVSHSTFGDPNFGQGPNGPRFPFTHEIPHASPHCHNPGGACNFRPKHDSPICNQHQFFINQHLPRTNIPQQLELEAQMMGIKPPKLTQQQYMTKQRQRTVEIRPQIPEQPQRRDFYAFDEMYQAQEMAGNAAGMRGKKGAAAWTNAYHNIHTEQPRACKYSYVYNNGSKEKSTSSSTSSVHSSGNRSTSNSRRTSSDTRETSPVAAAVQILPETLVTGAVNVASSAINTARSVIDMLRPRHDDSLVWDQIPAAIETSLQKLNEMGFNNRELNIMLLKKHNNDVSRVISELVQ